MITTFTFFIIILFFLFPWFFLWFLYLNYCCYSIFYFWKFFWSFYCFVISSFFPFEIVLFESHFITVFLERIGLLFVFFSKNVFSLGKCFILFLNFFHHLFIHKIMLLHFGYNLLCSCFHINVFIILQVCKAFIKQVISFIIILFNPHFNIL
jgi:hypothetical protein